MDPVQTNNQQQNQLNQQQPVSPVGNAQKEVSPIPQSDEFMKVSEIEPNIHPELQEAGVEVVKTEPDLTLEDKRAGLSLAKETIPHPTQPIGVVTLPMTKAEEQKIAKNVSPTHSIRWLVEIFHKIRKKGG